MSRYEKSPGFQLITSHYNDLSADARAAKNCVIGLATCMADAGLTAREAIEKTALIACLMGWNIEDATSDAIWHYGLSLAENGGEGYTKDAALYIIEWGKSLRVPLFKIIIEQKEDGRKTCRLQTLQEAAVRYLEIAEKRPALAASAAQLRGFLESAQILGQSGNAALKAKLEARSATGDQVALYLLQWAAFAGVEPAVYKDNKIEPTDVEMAERLCGLVATHQSPTMAAQAGNIRQAFVNLRVLPQS